MHGPGARSTGTSLRLNSGMASTRIEDPQSRQWTVRRKWVHRKLRWRGPKRTDLDFTRGVDLTGFADVGDDLPIIGVILTVIALVLIAIVAVMFIIPAVIFLAELLIVVAIVGAGLAARVLFGRPWTIEAHRDGTDDIYEWKVNGWRASGDLVRSVADQLRVTGEPTGGTRP